MVLVEPKDAGKRPIAGFFMNTEGGEALAGRAKKQRIGVYMEKELVERADEMASYVGARSRNEFVAEGVKFYIGILKRQKTICSSPYPPCSPVPYMTVKTVWRVWILSLQWRFPNWLM